MRTGWQRAALASAAGVIGLVLLAASGLPGAPAEKKAKEPLPPTEDFSKTLKALPYRIIYETWQNDNWELFSVKADGSDPVNLTKTPDLSELYPHVSPDGTKICFIVEEGSAHGGEPTARSAWYMNLDGTGRTKVADAAREACWNGDGTVIAYLKAEFPDKFVYEDFATRGIGFYDLKTGKRTDHPNKDLHHLYNLCWAPDGKWFVATVHAGMDYKHAILAIEAGGTRVVDLKIPGCRPDLSPDGRRIAWGSDDTTLQVADIHWDGPAPRVDHARVVMKSEEPLHVYHIDWSPDGKYVAFSRGPKQKNLKAAPEIIGVKAKGWNIGVADAEKESVWWPITTDGACDKEPDWAPLVKEERH